MRYLLAIFIVGMFSCGDSLWNPYIRDTPENCKNAGCSANQICNVNSGLCEDQVITILPVDCTQTPSGCFSTNHKTILSDPLLVAYKVAAADLMGNQNFDLAISGENTNLCILSGDQILSNPMITSCLGVTTGSEAFAAFDTKQTIIYMLPYLNAASGNLELLAATQGNRLLFIDKEVVRNKSLPTGMDTLSGFKILFAGDLNGDHIDDVVVTSSILPLATHFFPTGSGDMQVILGAANGTLLPTRIPTSSFSSLSLAASVSGRLGSTYNLSLMDPASSKIRLYKYTNSGDIAALQPVLEVDEKSKKFDFAIPVDLDSDGDYDLILAKTMDLSLNNIPLSVGALEVAYNIGNSNSPQFAEPIAVGTAPDDSFSDLFGIQIDDFDQDGYPDLIVTLFVRNTIAIYRNMQGKGFVQADKVTNTYFPRDAAVVDVDGDGCKDLVALFSGQLSLSGSFVNLGAELLITRGHYNLQQNRTQPACL